MNANAYHEKKGRIQNTVLYGAHNVDKPNLVQAGKVADSCLKVDSGVGGTVAVYVGHIVLLKCVRNCGDFRDG